MSDDEPEPRPEPEPEQEPPKKGMWTLEEDAILKEHVEEHGECKWNDVTSLNRNRWRNHLKPNLNKGPISPDDEYSLAIVRMSDDVPESRPEPEPPRKGTWTLEEDAILKEYVEEQGEGYWNDVSKNTCLNRCGKSCRLRWKNYLKPNLNKGPISPDEEAFIFGEVERIGKRWSEIVKQLPGRTDNDVKNFWYARSRRKPRGKAGLGRYDDDPKEYIHHRGWIGPRQQSHPSNNFQVRMQFRNHDMDPTTIMNLANVDSMQMRMPLGHDDTNQINTNVEQFENYGMNRADEMIMPYDMNLENGNMRQLACNYRMNRADTDITSIYGTNQEEYGLVRDDPYIGPRQRSHESLQNSRAFNDFQVPMDTRVPNLHIENANHEMNLANANMAPMQIPFSLADMNQENANTRQLACNYHMNRADTDITSVYGTDQENVKVMQFPNSDTNQGSADIILPTNYEYWNEEKNVHMMQLPVIETEPIRFPACFLAGDTRRFPPLIIRVSDDGPEPEPLRKCLWTPEEDAILKEYVEEHGEGNWKDVSKNTSLNRCDSSCRFRWKNYLKPNLNKDPISPAEEAFIFSEVERIGTRWSEIVKQLPGRTDNDIKNFWHTRTKQKEKKNMGQLACNCHMNRADTDITSVYCTNQENVSMIQFPNSETVQGGGIEMGTYNARRHHELYMELYDALISDTPKNITAENIHIEVGPRSNVIDLLQMETRTVDGNAMASSQTETGTGASTSADSGHEYYDLYDAGSFPTATGEDDFTKIWDDYDELTGQLLSEHK